MRFKMLLGYAFKNWTKQDCEHMIERSKEHKDYRFAGNVASYVLLKKFA